MEMRLIPRRKPIYLFSSFFASFFTVSLAFIPMEECRCEELLLEFSMFEQKIQRTRGSLEFLEASDSDELPALLFKRCGKI